MNYLEKIILLMKLFGNFLEVQIEPKGFKENTKIYTFIANLQILFLIQFILNFLNQHLKDLIRLMSLEKGTKKIV